MKYLVVVKWIGNMQPMSIVGVCDTKEEAKEYIDKKNEGMIPNGLGYDDIIEVEEL